MSVWIKKGHGAQMIGVSLIAYSKDFVNPERCHFPITSVTPLNKISKSFTFFVQGRDCTLVSISSTLEIIHNP